jgi:hypothetical protein
MKLNKKQLLIEEIIKQKDAVCFLQQALTTAKRPLPQE